MNNVNVCSFVNVNGVTPTPFSLGPIPKHNSDYYNGFVVCFWSNLVTILSSFLPGFPAVNHLVKAGLYGYVLSTDG